MSQLWAAVTNLQRGLDEAAGISTLQQGAAQGGEKKTTGASDANGTPAGTSSNGAAGAAGWGVVGDDDLDALLGEDGDGEPTEHQQPASSSEELLVQGDSTSAAQLQGLGLANDADHLDTVGADSGSKGGFKGGFKEEEEEEEQIAPAAANLCTSPEPKVATSGRSGSLLTSGAESHHRAAVSTSPPAATASSTKDAVAVPLPTGMDEGTGAGTRTGTGGGGGTPPAPSVSTSNEQHPAGVDRREGEGGTCHNTMETTSSTGAGAGPSVAVAPTLTEERLRQENTELKKILQDQCEALATAQQQVKLLKTQHQQQSPPSPSQQQANTSSGSSSREDALIKEGMELSENLGKAHMRNRQLSDELEKLQGTITQLEGKVEHHMNKERQWKDSVKTSTQNEAALHEQSLALTKQMQQLVEENETLSSDLDRIRQEAAEAELQCQAQADEGESHLSSLKEQWGAEVHELTGELERLREGRRRDTLEHDRKINWLQTELSQAHQRAHEAEMRAADVGRSVTESAAELRQQLSDMEHRYDTLKSQFYGIELEGEEWKEKHSSTQQRILQLERTLKEKETEASQNMSEARKRIAGLDKELATANIRISSLLDEQQQFQLPSPPAGTRTPSRSTGEEGVVDTPGGANSKKELAELKAELSAVRSELLQARQQRAPYMYGGGGRGSLSTSGHTSAGYVASGVGSGAQAQGRVDRELVKCQLELAELHKVKAERDTLQGQLHGMTTQHDMLLQMYGSQQEVIDELKETVDATKLSYQSQVEQLGAELAALRKQ